MLTTVYKVYNTATCKSVHIMGYDLIQDLTKRTGLHTTTLQWIMRDLKKKGTAYVKGLSIDKV